MTTFLAFIEVALCYILAGANYGRQINDLVVFRKPDNFKWYDALFLAFAPISVPGAILYVAYLYFTDKNEYND